MAAEAETNASHEGTTSVMVDPVTGKPVPMKDGKPCRVCTDFKTWSRLEKQKAKQEERHAKQQEQTKAEEKHADDSAKLAQEIIDEEWRRKNCPADVETLGNATWTLLHTMAAYYPDRPAPSQMESMRAFIHSFAEHYPCWYCKVIRMLYYHSLGR